MSGCRLLRGLVEFGSEVVPIGIRRFSEGEKKMAGVKGPLYSAEAHGTFARRIQFRRHRGGVHVWFAPDPDHVNQRAASESQAEVRAIYSRTHAAWLLLSPEQQQVWREAGKSQAVPLRAWDYFFQQQRHLYLYLEDYLLTATGHPLLTDDGSNLVA